MCLYHRYTLVLSIFHATHTEHQNFIGIDENLGPVAISLKREKVSDDLLGVYGTVANVGPVVSTKHQYRVLLRTSEVREKSFMIIALLLPVLCTN